MQKMTRTVPKKDPKAIEPIYDVHGLKVYGTQKQIAEYAKDHTEYDLVKSRLENIANIIKPTCSDNNKMLRAFRIGDDPRGEATYLIAISGKGDKQNPTFMAYNSKRQTFLKGITANMLEEIRDDYYYARMDRNLTHDTLSAYRELPEACETLAFETMRERSAALEME